MPAFLPTPNASGQCCESPCEKETPCADCCPCDPLPGEILVVQYTRLEVGNGACRRLAWVVTDCDVGTWDGAACQYKNNVATVEFTEEPVGLWFAGAAPAEFAGCENLHGYYLDEEGGFAYLVTTPGSDPGTIDGGILEDENCQPCEPVEVEDCFERETCVWK